MAWNLTVCSSPSIVKMSNMNRGEQVLAGLVPPQASPPIREGEGPANSGGSPKRQFFSAFDQQDEVLEEDIAEDFLPQSDQKKRKLTVEQVRFLEESFEMENKLDPERKTQIAKELGLPQRQVAVWFQNRRARSKNKQLEKDYAALKTEYDAVVRENEKLQAELARLTAQLQSLDTTKLVMKQGGSENWGDGVEILQELGGKTKKQVGVKIEVEVSTDHEVLGSSSPSKCEVVDFFATSPAVAPLKLDDTILSSDQELQLMCNPVLLQQLALKLEGGCLADDSYNLFFAQFWEEPALFPWCD